MSEIEPVANGPAPGWYPANGELRYWDGAQWTEHRAPASTPLPAQPAGVAAYPGYSTVVTDARQSGIETALAWVFTVLTLGYFLPWAVAATRGKSNSLIVLLLNFLLGWTLIGWIVALVMACTAHQVVAMRNH